MEIVHRPREDARSASGEKICMAWRPGMALERPDDATASSARDARDLAVAALLEGFGASPDGDGDGATGNTTPHFFAASSSGLRGD
ncbi:uncharacterized protein TrAtP1_007552 [Trichoderma atroviride]|uniref:uncharacterized protein n=1 Tax=Hypocrea atroviridis TaxID=63577 RepID=UPI00332A3C6B|nr:hypothetical protein TrAtP1_007552 [Trichoderma atroviride]